MKGKIHIIIAEPSLIISEGLKHVILNSGAMYDISIARSLDEIQGLCQGYSSNIVIINPSIIQNCIKSFPSLRDRIENTRWIGLIYAYHEQHLLSLFDGIITISDDAERIISTLSKYAASDVSDVPEQSGSILSEREIDVLKLLTSGNANKEIADKLNISINTVITHRKNISQKTGIKSVSGLTIYAVLKNHISIDNLKG
jgi:DNA-binding NarL/FixJ family response regulator